MTSTKRRAGSRSRDHWAKGGVAWARDSDGGRKRVDHTDAAHNTGDENATRSSVQQAYTDAEEHAAQRVEEGMAVPAVKQRLEIAAESALEGGMVEGQEGSGVHDGGEGLAKPKVE